MVHHTAIVDWIFFDEDGDVVPTAGLAQVLYRVDLVGHVGGLLLDTLVVWTSFFSDGVDTCPSQGCDLGV
jgi:hypothetical protein